VRAGDTRYEAESVIIATGASARMLGVPGERELLGRGVSTCATCDGFFFKDRDVMVVGGGDSAMEEALYLARLARTVAIVHRRDALRASKIMQERVSQNPRIEVVLDSAVESLADPAAGALSRVTLRDVKTGARTERRVDGLFVAIGHDPNTALFVGQLDHDETGYLVTKPGSTETNIPGVFAAGDVQDHIYRQAVTAAGSGCMAALDAERFLAAEESSANPVLTAAPPEAETVDV